MHLFNDNEGSNHFLFISNEAGKNRVGSKQERGRKRTREQIKGERDGV
jgi:hypothetical protein